jgi:hypothetical protein
LSRPIGYYIHHHGHGHRQRAIAIGQSLDDVMLMGTGLAGRTGNLPFLDLPDDRLDASFAGIDHADRPASLHYAPLDHEGIRQRIRRMAGWIAEARPRLMVVDVSAEVAMLARLASVPTVYVRLSGKRLDPAHLDAFRGATGLLAPFHEAMDDDDIPIWIREKTFHAPGIIQSDRHYAPGGDSTVLVVVGRGGGISDGERWAAAARATPAWRWRVIGPCTMPCDMPDNLELRGGSMTRTRRLRLPGWSSAAPAMASSAPYYRRAGLTSVYPNHGPSTSRCPRPTAWLPWAVRSCAASHLIRGSGPTSSIGRSRKISSGPLA